MRKRLLLLLPAALFGAVLSLTYISPHTGTITLSDLALQLSGGSLEFPLGFSIGELMSFTLRLLPTLLLEAAAGTAFYRYYCTASVYIFSRIADRRRWYLHEVRGIAAQAALYQLVLLVCAVLVTAVRFTVVFDSFGWLLLAYHFCLYTLWSIAFTLFINLLAVRLGSSAAFSLLAAAQAVPIALLGIAGGLSEESAGFAAALRANPVARLVLSRQSSRIPALAAALERPNAALYLEDSLLLVAALCALAVLLGVSAVQRHDLLANDAEIGGNG